MREYVVNYERAGDNFSAYVPDLPGCVACGDTIEEVKALMAEAITIYMESLKEEGRSIPEPSTKAGVIVVG